jgi:aryl-alcohol dehydrogenase-like predicted oxidoreductase
MELRGPPRGRPITDDQARAVLNAVLDAGINYVDTSIDYGVSEELIGRHIADRRSEYFLATKCGCPLEPATEATGPRAHVFTRENILAGIEQSLRRMQTDYVDVLQFHASPAREVLEQEQAVETLRDLQRQGKVRFLGMSGTLPNLRDHIAMGVFDVFQIPYSALQRQHEAAISEAAAGGAGIVIRGGVARGGPGKEQGVFWDSWQQTRLDDLLEGGMDRMEFTLRFTLSHPDLHTTIVGTMDPEHLRQNLAAAERGPLPLDLYEEAKRRLEVAGFAP